MRKVDAPLCAPLCVAKLDQVIANRKSPCCYDQMNKIKIASHVTLARFTLISTVALLGFFAVGCQHGSAHGDSSRPVEATFMADAQWGQVGAEFNSNAQEHVKAAVIVAPQWHLSPDVETKSVVKDFPQRENQVAIFEQLSRWIEAGQIKTVIAEGCEGEIEDLYPIRFNGWTLSDLKTLDETTLKPALAPVWMKLKAKWGTKIHVVCGDDLKLMHESLLALSDIRGVSGFLMRIRQYQKKSDAEHVKSYVTAAKQVMKLDANLSEQNTVIALKKALDARIDRFQTLLNQRSDRFAQKAATVDQPAAIVIGALHIKRILTQLTDAKIANAVFKPKGVKGDELSALEDLIRATN